MAHRNGAGPALEFSKREAGKVVSTGKCCTFKPTRSKIQAIRAELIGSNTARACGIAARGHTPALAMCAALVGAGFNPDRALHCYRGKMLCLVIRSVGEAAELTVNSKGTGFIKAAHAVRKASPIDQPPVRGRFPLSGHRRRIGGAP